MPKTAYHHSPKTADSNSLIRQQGPTSQTHQFQCDLCPKRFSSIHALGGHQKAHKKKREEELKLHKQQQQKRRLIQSPCPFVFFPVLAMASHGSILTQPLMNPVWFQHGSVAEKKSYLGFEEKGEGCSGSSSSDEKCCEEEELDLTLRL